MDDETGKEGTSEFAEGDKGTLTAFENKTGIWPKNNKVGFEGGCCW